MGGQSRKVRRGGGIQDPGVAPSPVRYGVDVSGIGGFSPTQIQGLALWFTGDPTKIVRQPIAEYIKEQLPVYKAFLLNQLGARLQEQVITQIISKTATTANALVPVETHDPTAVGFPSVMKIFEKPDGFAIGRTTLVTRDTLQLPPNFSYFSISNDIHIQYNDILDRIIVTPTGPNATFHEIIVYSRQLRPEEVKLVEGYVTYRSDQQFILPRGHPYFPDMSADPILKSVTDKLNEAAQALGAAQTRLNQTYQTYMAKVGTTATAAAAAPIRGQLTDAIQHTDLLNDILSRGFLLVRGGAAPVDLQAVYAAINAKDLYAVDLNDAQMALELKRFQEITDAANKYTQELGGNADLIVAGQNFAINQETIETARKEAETEEGLRTMEFQVRRREFVQAQRVAKKDIRDLGSMLLGNFKANFQADLTTCREAFEYQTSQRDKRLKGINTAFEALAPPFRAGTWAAEFQFLDQAQPTAGEFRDPILRGIQEKFRRIEAALLADDITHLNIILGIRAKEAAELSKLWSTRPQAALFRPLYVGHLRQSFQRSERLQNDMDARMTELEAALKSLQEDIETLRTTHALIPKPLNLLGGVYKPQNPVYYSAVTLEDAAILRMDYVITEETGAPRLELGPTGDMDMEFFFPEFYSLEKQTDPPNSWRQATPYRDLSGQPIYQTYIQRNPLAISIVNQLPASRLPTPHLAVLSGAPNAETEPYEIPREYVNSIVRLQGASATLQAPINLPKYAVRTEAFYILQNTGHTTLVIRNPGSKEDSFDLLGPGEATIYLYGEGRALTETPGYAYGRYPWAESMLPYDMLQATPRSSLACHITELGRTIYLSGTSEPLLDHNGYYVECRRATDDGNVYDLHDFSRANPYSVRTLPEMSLAALRPAPTAKGRLAPPRQGPIQVVADHQSSLAILCGPDNLPAVDEFGQVAVAACPIYAVGTELRVRGAYEDLKILGSDVHAYIPYAVPAGISFDAVYRSRFCKPLATSADGSIRVPIFCTAQGLPICSSKGIYIYLPKDAKQEQTLLTFKDINGTKQAFLIDEDRVLPAGPGEDLLWRPVAEILKSQAVIAAAHQVIFRYARGIAYIKQLSENYTAAGEALRAALGEEITTSFRASLEETKRMIDDRMAKFSEKQPALKAISDGLSKDAISGDTIISLGVFDVQMRDTLQEIVDLDDTIRAPLDAYMLLIQRHKTTKEFVESLGTQGKDLFTKGYGLISAIRKFEIERTQSVSTPEVDSLANSLKEREAGYKISQAALEAAAAKQQTSVGEMREWLLDLQRDASKQYSALETAKGLILMELPRRLLEANKADANAARQELLAIQKEEEALAHTADPILKFLGPPPMGGAEPEIQDPMVSRTKKGPFAHLVEPNYQRDIKGTLFRMIPPEMKIDYELMRADLDAAITRVEPFRAEMSNRASAAALAPHIPDDVNALSDLVTKERDTLRSYHSKLAEFEATMEPIFQGYNAMSSALSQALTKSTQATLEGLKKRAEDVEAQRLAIETAARAAAPDKRQAAEEILQKIPTASPSEAVAAAERHVQPVLTGAITNPFVIKIALEKFQERRREFEALEAAVQAQAATMRSI